MAHTIETELLSKAPRLIYPGSTVIQMGNLVFRFLVVLLIGLGIGMFSYFCLQLMLGSGAPVTGHITAIDLPPAASTEAAPDPPDLKAAVRDAASPRNPTLEYSFTVGGRTFAGNAPITPTQLKLLPSGDEIRVRCLPVFMDMLHRPILPNDTFWGWLGILALITLVSEVAIGTLCWFAFTLPNEQRWLYKHGAPAVATITRMEFTGGEARACIAYYRFETGDSLEQTGKSMPQGGKKLAGEVLGEMRLNQTQANSLSPGDEVTVLYARDHPERSVLYPFGMYSITPRKRAAI